MLLVVPSVVHLLMCRFYSFVGIGVVESGYLLVLCYALSYRSVDLKICSILAQFHQEGKRTVTFLVGRRVFVERFRCGFYIAIAIRVVALSMKVNVLVRCVSYLGLVVVYSMCCSVRYS